MDLASSLNVISLHQHPPSDNSHANGWPHDSQVMFRRTAGPNLPM
jgi:hypothetical protein